MTATTFCDFVGVRMLVLTRRQAVTAGTDLRLVLPCSHVLRVMQGVDALLPVYRNRGEAPSGLAVTTAGTPGSAICAWLASPHVSQVSPGLSRSYAASRAGLTRAAFTRGWRGRACVYPDEGQNVMSHIADGAQAPPSAERPTGELVKQLSEQVSALVREELKLAQLEMTRKGKQAGVGAGMLGGGGLIALYGLGCLIACVILAISEGLVAWLAALIVGVALLGAAGAAALVGKSRLQKATPPVPKETVGSVKTDVEVIKERARR